MRKTDDNDDLQGMPERGESRERTKDTRIVRLAKAALLLLVFFLGLRWFFATRIIVVRNLSSKDMGPLLVEIEGVSSRRISIPRGHRESFLLDGWARHDTSLRVLHLRDGVSRELVSCGYESWLSGSYHYVVILLDEDAENDVCEPIHSFNPLFYLD